MAGRTTTSPAAGVAVLICCTDPRRCRHPHAAREHLTGIPATIRCTGRGVSPHEASCRTRTAVCEPGDSRRARSRCRAEPLVMSIALASAQHAPPFNAVFYATIATIIPIFFLAIAVQGRLYEDLVKTSISVLEWPRKARNFRQY